MVDFSSYNWDDPKDAQKARDSLYGFVDQNNPGGYNKDALMRGFSGFQSLGRDDPNTFKAYMWDSITPAPQDGPRATMPNDFLGDQNQYNTYRGNYDAFKAYNERRSFGTEQALKATPALVGQGADPRSGTFQTWRQDNPDVRIANQWTPEQDAGILKSIGYTGDPAGATSYFNQNPAKYQQYLTQRRAADSMFDPSTMDLNPNIGGNQQISPEINKYLGSLIGYNGEVGGGQLGSGMEGVDYLNYVTPEMRQNYINTRQVFEPNYAWGGNAPVGNSAQNSPITTTAPPSVQDTSVRRDRPAAMDLPVGLQWLRDYTDQQKRAAIATQGIYGTGNDRDTSEYYLNLLQRSAINNFGGADTNVLNNLLPIEGNYLQYLNVPYGGSDEFLSGLGRYYAMQ